MHTSLHTNNYSVRDFYYLDLNTPVGRAQIRDELEHGFRVPEEVVLWFFEEIDLRDQRYAQLEKALAP
jgi:hypothetical protein